jgi:DNA-binding transcriptional ArsR family regulator
MIPLHIEAMDAEHLDRVFKALADPIRRRIIDRLQEKPNQSLFQICALATAEGERAISRQAVSQHLDMLEKAGLVRISWSGRTKVHSLDLKPLRSVAKIWLGKHLDEGERS